MLFWSVVVLVVGLFYKRVSACFTHVSSGSLTRSAFSSVLFAFVLAVLAATASSPAPAQSHIFLLSAEGGRVRNVGAGVAIVQGTFCLRFLWLATTQTKKKRIGIINSLLHLLLSGANCVFVYIILCWPNDLKVLVPVLPAFKVLSLPPLNYHCFLFCGPTAAL